MRIFSIELENFRMFEKKRVEFPAMFSVLIGENGTGKTTILDALGGFLQTALIESHQPFDGFKPRLGNRDLLQKGPPTRYWLDEYDNFVRSKALKISSEFSLDGLKSLSSSMDFIYLGGARTGPFIGPLDDFYEYAKRSDELLKSKGNPDLPVVEYFGSQYYRTEDWEEIDFMSNGSRIENGYLGAMTHFSINLKYFRDWYKTFSANAKEFDPEKFPEKVYLVEHLSCISSAISTAVPEWKDLRFDFAEKDIVGRLEIPEAKGQLRPYRDLSDGYRRVIGMVAILAWRCVRLNPHHGKNAHLESTGIVLIDEIDLHLHPNWQKRIVNDLRRTFPKIQFICTTHSPFIVQSLAANEVINLDASLGDLPQTYAPDAMTLGEVVTEVMGVDNIRSDNFEERYEKAKLELGKIKTKNGKLTMSDFDEVSKIMGNLLEQETNDPVYRAYLEFQNRKNHLANETD